MKRSYTNCQKQSSHQLFHDNSLTTIEANDLSNNEDMDEEKDESKRKSRNLSEKKRRDQFNLLISELCSIINYDSNYCSETMNDNSNNKHKMDKSSILRSAIAFLKTHSDLIEETNDKQELNQRKKSNELNIENKSIFSWKPSFLVNDEFIYLMLEALDSFMIIIDATSEGRIIYISETVVPLLGMLSSQINTKLIKTNDDSQSHNLTIYDLIHEEERIFMEKILEGKANDESAHGFTSVLLHFKDHDINSESDKYQLVRLLGSFYNMNDFGGKMFHFADQQKCFVAIGRLQTPKFLRELNFQTSNNDYEFISRHSLEWKFLYLDHRAPPIIGYLPFEILGTSGYDYYHWNDLEDIVAGHESLMRTGEGTSCIYRFLTKSQQWIWLRTSYYIAYHQWNSKPEFIVCTHTVVKDSEVSNAKIGKINQKIKNKIEKSVMNVRKTTHENCPNSGTDNSGVIKAESSDNRSVECQESKPNTSDPIKNPSLLHEFLQQKHELLQHQIQQQQEELRRVSEQLNLVKAVNND